MKKILLLLCIVSILSGCSKQTTIPQVATEKTTDTIDKTLANYISEYQYSIINEKFPITPTLYILKNENEIIKKEIINFEDKKYNDIILELLQELQLSIDFDTSENKDSIIVNFSTTPLFNEEVSLLESIATTLHKNYKKNIIFRINNKEYNSNALFFGLEEPYPVNTNIL